MLMFLLKCPTPSLGQGTGAQLNSLYIFYEYNTELSLFVFTVQKISLLHLGHHNKNTCPDITHLIKIIM